jgi:hypothetical protein
MGALAAAAVVAASVGVSSVALGAETTAAVSSQAATGAYDLDFTLPSESKAGCMVCHGDPNLIRLKQEQLKSYWIDPVVIGKSAHGPEQCVGCHIDFTYKAPHDGGIPWQETAKSACKNCHDGQFGAYAKGAHSPTVATTDTADANGEKPLCGDCHGSHDISLLTTDTPVARAGRDALHSNGWEVCGRCHEDYWDSYDDHYHGAAFKRGALDAPACWDCHGGHEVLAADNRDSEVNEAHLVETCRKCHVGATEEYVEYAAFIHGRGELQAANPLFSAWDRVVSFVRGIFGGA